MSFRDDLRECFGVDELEVERMERRMRTNPELTKFVRTQTRNRIIDAVAREWRIWADRVFEDETMRAQVGNRISEAIIRGAEE